MIIPIFSNIFVMTFYTVLNIGIIIVSPLAICGRAARAYTRFADVHRAHMHLRFADVHNLKGTRTPGTPPPPPPPPVCLFRSLSAASAVVQLNPYTACTNIYMVSPASRNGSCDWENNKAQETVQNLKKYRFNLNCH